MKNQTYLRALEPDDYLNINRWHNDEKTYSTITANKFYISSVRDKAWVKSKSMGDSKNMYFAVCLMEDNIMIGYCSLINIDLINRKGLIGGMTIDLKYQNKRLGHSVFVQLLDYAFSDMGLNKLYTGYLKSHLVTSHALKLFGFVDEMLLRQSVFKLGKFHDVIVASLLSEDYYKNIIK